MFARKIFGGGVRFGLVMFLGCSLLLTGESALTGFAAVAGANLRIRELAGVRVVNQSPQFPARANELNGKLVTVNGFMVPLGMGEGKLRKFVLIEVPLSCCFADGPGIDQMIFVSLAPGKELDYASDFPVTVTGRFQAGAQKNQYGQIESLYRIVGGSAKKLGE